MIEEDGLEKKTNMVVVVMVVLMYHIEAEAAGFMMALASLRCLGNVGHQDRDTNLNQLKCRLVRSMTSSCEAKKKALAFLSLAQFNGLVGCTNTPPR